MYRICALLLSIVSSFAFSAAITCPENHCIAVVNAGNSGSRLHVYSYELDASNTPTNIKNIFSNRVDPGIAAIELSQRAITEYLATLFSEQSNAKIPVYFYATSGMRMLSFARQQAYYAKIKHWFSKHPEWQLIDAKTLTSQEEALYGWLSLNYELGRLTSTTEPLVGVIDAGSASTQIAFPVKNTQHIHPNDYIKLHIYGRDISLFTHGFLGLGQDEIRNQYLDQTVCFPTHYPLPNGLQAAGNFPICEQKIKPLINEIHDVKKTVEEVIQDHPNQTWYLIGGISVMLQEKPFTFAHHQVTARALAEKANKQVCQQDWSVLGTLYPDNKHMFTSCLNASYAYSLFVEGFGMQETQPIHYISNKISTNDWTLGVAVYQRNF
ncbi:MAG: multidrug DMT transporter permease [Legionellaceae bacterium]|nr:multidrug DMT transporter permease [Legionellaceae bacterium]